MLLRNLARLNTTPLKHMPGDESQSRFLLKNRMLLCGMVSNLFYLFTVLSKSIGAIFAL